jgi:hypothetical protein
MSIRGLFYSWIIVFPHGPKQTKRRPHAGTSTVRLFFLDHGNDAFEFIHTILQHTTIFVRDQLTH